MSPAARAQDVVHHSASCPLYALAWSSRLHASPRIAVGSFVDKYSNKVDLLQFDGNSLEQIGTFEHSYPATKIRWIPDQEGTHPELLGTTGDFLRIWEVDDDCKTHLRYTLNNVSVGVCLPHDCIALFFISISLPFFRVAISF